MTHGVCIGYRRTTYWQLLVSNVLYLGVCVLVEEMKFVQLNVCYFCNNFLPEESHEEKSIRSSFSFLLEAQFRFQIFQYMVHRLSLDIWLGLCCMCLVFIND